MMNHLLKRFITAFALVIYSGLALADHITVTGAWLPEAAPVARVMAAYMDISNKDKDTSYITAVSSPQFEKVEIHSMSHKDGMMHMERQDKLALPAGETVSLQPGGYHMMLFRPRQWYKAGSEITLQITLDDKHTFQVVAPVIKK
jgi:copper(I)-binding protein